MYVIFFLYTCAFWPQKINGYRFSHDYFFTTMLWGCVDNFDGIRAHVEEYGIQNCEQLISMGGCEQGGDAFCCACPKSAKGISMFWNCYLILRIIPRNLR